MRVKAFVLTLAVLIGAGIPIFGAVVDYFMKMDGVPGDAKAPAFAGWTGLSAINWGDGTSNSPVTNTIGGHPGPQCSIHEITVTKVADKSSTKLSQFCATGKHFPQATISVGGERHLLQDVTVKSVRDVQMADGSVRELITLDYGRCATHETQVRAEGLDDKHKAGFSFGTVKTVPANAILIGLTPRPEAHSLIGLLFNGDGRSATLTRKAGGENGFRQAFQTKHVIPTLTITLNNGQKWTFTNVTVSGFTGGVKPGTESLSLNFTKVEGPLGGFQDLAYKE